MTAREIKQALRRNKILRRRPCSLSQLAQLKGVSPSMMTTAVKNPRRYPDARRFIEAHLLDTVETLRREKAS